MIINFIDSTFYIEETEWGLNAISKYFFIWEVDHYVIEWVGYLLLSYRKPQGN